MKTFVFQRKPGRALGLLLVLGAFAILALSVPHGFAQGTAFTYQGRLNESGLPATGTYDLRFTIYDSPGAGNAVASQPSSGVGLTNGLFTVTLDFGAGVFMGAPRWLEIAVRPAGGGAFTTLNPRQPITPAPYAIFAIEESGWTERGLSECGDLLPLSSLADLSASEGASSARSLAGCKHACQCDGDKSPAQSGDKVPALQRRQQFRTGGSDTALDPENVGDGENENLNGIPSQSAGARGTIYSGLED